MKLIYCNKYWGKLVTTNGKFNQRAFNLLQLSSCFLFPFGWNWWQKTMTNACVHICYYYIYQHTLVQNDMVHVCVKLIQWNGITKPVLLASTTVRIISVIRERNGLPFHVHNELALHSTPSQSFRFELPKHSYHQINN